MIEPEGILSFWKEHFHGFEECADAMEPIGIAKATSTNTILFIFKENSRSEVAYIIIQLEPYSNTDYDTGYSFNWIYNDGIKASSQLRIPINSLTPILLYTLRRYNYE